MAGIHDHQFSCSGNKRFHVALLFVFLICTSNFCEEIMAMRLLNGEQWMPQNLVIQSLPRGPVPPSTSNPCTDAPTSPGYPPAAAAPWPPPPMRRRSRLRFLRSRFSLGQFTKVMLNPNSEIQPSDFFFFSV